MSESVSTYAWEITDEEVAARHGVPLERILRYDMNTSPVAPALVAERLGQPFWPPLNEYPWTDYRALTEAAAAHVGARREEILVGCGADEVLDMCTRAFLRAGEAAVIPVPTYAMFRVVVEQRGGRVVTVPRRPAEEGFGVDVEALAEAVAREDARLVFLCRPNNPTGSIEPRAAVLELLARIPGATVVVDEAYAEFAGDSLVSERERLPNLVVVRTLSKAFGLAGVRVGYAVASRLRIAEIERFRPPGSISTVSATIGEAALRRPDAMRATVARLAAERERFAERLRSLGWLVHPSVANFLLVRPDGSGPAAAVAARMLARGMVPRTFDLRHPLADHLRLTVRTPEDDDRLVAVFAAEEVRP